MYRMGFYSGTVTADTDLIPTFFATERLKRAELGSLDIAQIAIEAPSGTEVTIGDTTFEMPSTGMFETDVNMIRISSLSFGAAVGVKIFYFY